MNHYFSAVSYSEHCCLLEFSNFILTYFSCLLEFVDRATAQLILQFRCPSAIRDQLKILGFERRDQ